MRVGEMLKSFLIYNVYKINKLISQHFWTELGRLSLSQKADYSNVDSSKQTVLKNVQLQDRY